MGFRYFSAVFLVAVVVFAQSLGAPTVSAQDVPLGDGPPPAVSPPLGEGGGFRAIDELGGLGNLPGLGAGPGADPISGFARFELEKGTRNGRLHVEASIEDGWHIYSITQMSGGPTPTEIRVAKSDVYKVTGDFLPDADPHIAADSPFPGVVVEEQRGRLIWTAPIELKGNADPQSIEIEVTLSYQACEDIGSCLAPAKQKLVAKFAGEYEVKAATGKLRPTDGHVTWKGHVEPKTVRPGDTATLVLRAEPDAGWHVYAWELVRPKEDEQPTLIALTRWSDLRMGRIVASAQPISKSGGPGEPTFRYHEEPVEWRVPLTVPADAKPGPLSLAGLIGFQTCSEVQCDFPSAAKFTAELNVGESTEDGTSLLNFSEGPKLGYKDAAALAQTQADRLGQFYNAPYWYIFTLAFLGGLILNIMPCVLPVIGLKVMSFVQQAGENRLRIFALNFWFVAGMILVFMLLASGAAFFGLKWGDQVRLSPTFNIFLTATMFVFGLSFLGVWEIPIPGFVGGSSASKIAEKEGLFGAFTKGVLSTILATPCAGPLVIPVLNWALTQTPGLVYSTFFCMGIGMASPFLLIGAFPAAIRWLPKPGAWMETFKQLMGFALMGTAVYLLTATVGDELRTATLAMSVGLAIACWLAGRIPVTAEFRGKMVGWLGVLGVTLVSIAISFGLFVTWFELDWQPFSRVALEENRKEGRTVLIDFTADW